MAQWLTYLALNASLNNSITIAVRYLIILVANVTNMATDFNINRGLEHPKSRKITNRVIYVVLALVILIVISVIYLSIAGKHIKIGPFEVNAPASKDTIQKPTLISTAPVYNNSPHQSGITNNQTVNYNK
jgi:hypothetical protein